MQKVKSFQGLRALAFLLIFLSHSISRCGWWGGFGVSLFIVLSGYLVGMNHYGNVPQAIPYAWLKMKKFFPLHLITFLFSIHLTISVPISQLFQTDKSGLIYMGKIAISNILMIQAFIPIGDFYYSYNSVSWYLTLVVFFALVTPVILKITRKANNPERMIGGGGAVEIILALVFHNTGIAHWILYICPFVRLIDYSIGINLYLIATERGRKNNRAEELFGWAISIATMLVTFFLPNWEYFSNVIWIFPTVFIIHGIQDMGSRNVLSIKPLVFLGNISMEMFLVHQLVIRQLQSKNDMIRNKEFLLMSLALGITIGISIALYGAKSFINNIRKKGVN